MQIITIEAQKWQVYHQYQVPIITSAEDVDISDKIEVSGIKQHRGAVLNGEIDMRRAEDDRRNKRKKMQHQNQQNINEQQQQPKTQQTNFTRKNNIYYFVIILYFI